jgi:hypothetical protein
VNNNRYYITLPVTSQEINIPIEITEDFLGRSDSIELYEDEVLGQVIGIPFDFEVGRYSHNEYSPTNTQTSVNYEFYFYSGNPNTLSATTCPLSSSPDLTLWGNNYLAEGFNSKELYYFANSFANSFFKLDFYDRPDEKNQTNYFTVIIPTQQGFTTTASISPYIAPVQVKIPKYKLDFVGDKEGFFFYWLNVPQFLTLDTFYMSMKFFDAKLGVFVRMMNEPQCRLPNKYQFDSSIYFYNKVKLNYDTKKYEIFDGKNHNNRIGTTTNPMKWYEYVNPPDL